MIGVKKRGTRKKKIKEKERENVMGKKETRDKRKELKKKH